MVALLVAPMVLQAATMLVDEGWFHSRRGLPRWERIGHPLDTLTVAATFAFALLAAPTPTHLAIYVGLAAFSCFFVTKDEPVHRRLCAPAECWLHAVMFLLHPTVFLAYALLWREGGHATLMALQLAATVAFGIFQVVRWA